MKPACHISKRLKACCDKCGDWPGVLHLPEEIHGWYCPRCCPACKAQPKADAPPVESPVEVPADATTVQAA